MKPKHGDSFTRSEAYRRPRSPSRPLLLFLALSAFSLSVPESGTANPKSAPDPLKEVEFTVSRQDGSKWIRLAAEYETSFPVAPATLYAVLNDYPGLPGVFSRVVAVKILSKNDAAIDTEQTSGVKAFGLEFYTTIRIHNTQKTDEVGYLRYASVYKDFQAAGDFERELGLLLEKKAPAKRRAKG